MSPGRGAGAPSYGARPRVAAPSARATAICASLEAAHLRRSRPVLRRRAAPSRPRAERGRGGRDLRGRRCPSRERASGSDSAPRSTAARASRRKRPVGFHESRAEHPRRRLRDPRSLRSDRDARRPRARPAATGSDRRGRSGDAIRGCHSRPRRAGARSRHPRAWRARRRAEPCSRRSRDRSFVRRRAGRARDRRRAGPMDLTAALRRPRRTDHPNRRRRAATGLRRSR